MSEKMSEKIYNVRLVNPKLGIDETIKVTENEYILDVAEKKELELPSSCKAGICVNCVGRLVIKDSQNMKAEIQRQIYHDYDFLKQKEMDAGFLLTCKASPRSDCEILTHQEDDLLDL